jgi:hypothetical protein
VTRPTGGARAGNARTRSAVERDLRARSWSPTCLRTGPRTMAGGPPAVSLSNGPPHGGGCSIRPRQLSRLQLLGPQVGPPGTTRARLSGGSGRRPRHPPGSSRDAPPRSRSGRGDASGRAEPHQNLPSLLRWWHPRGCH